MTLGPLMIDLEIAASQDRPEVPYLHQIEMMSELIARHRGRLMPFVMVDARRPEAANITLHALKELGFLA